MNEPIAIVGLSCRFPAAPSADDYWRLLVDGVDAIVETPRERWDGWSLYQADGKAPGKLVTRWGGYIEDCDKFDAAFFRVSPEEAERVDPQQRIMLELTWKALEDAGIAPDSLAGRDIGVFVGTSHSDYERMIYREIAGITGFEGPGAYHSIIANRVSYFFNFRGPSMVVDTACSSALSALHVATAALRNGECELAIVGGCSLNLNPEESISLSKAGLLSPSGRCRTFDDRADGFVRGEGFGVLILARSEVVRGRNLRTRAWVIASAANQDGASNGLMAPNGLAQRALLKDALRRGNLEPANIDYVEAHGTGTLLGDSIEFDALREVIGRDRSEPCLVGSVKTNIGHLEAASGMAGIIKVVLAMEHGAIPKQLHCEQPNRYIDLPSSGLRIVNELEPWPEREQGGYAGISTFGFGGANAHVVLRRASDTKTSEPPSERTEVLVASAKTDSALKELLFQLADTLQSPAPLDRVCYTLATGRAHFSHRFAASGTREQLATRLRAALGPELSFAPVRPPKLALWLGHDGADTSSLEHWPEVYRAAFAQAAEALREVSFADARRARSFCHGWSLSSLLSGWGVKLSWASGQGALGAGARALASRVGLRQLVSSLSQDASDIAGAQVDGFGKAKCTLLLSSGDVPTVAAAVPQLSLPSHPDELGALLASLYRAGVNLDWRAVMADKPRTPISLPTYPFLRERHWVRPVNHPDEGRLRRAALGSDLSAKEPATSHAVASTFSHLETNG